MNIQQMHIGVNLRVDRVSSNSSEGFLPDEIDYYLNRAIEQYIKQQYSIIKDETKDLQNQYVVENLRTIIKSQGITLGTPTATVIPFDIPNDYYYYLALQYISDGKLRNTTLRTPKGLKPYLTTATNSPLFREYPFIIENTQIKVYVNQNDIQTSPEANLSYIAKPTVVELDVDTPANNVNCNLPEHTHVEIVDIASQLLLQDITRQ